MKDLWLDGDLCQMADQSRALASINISLTSRDVYTIVAKEDVEKALTFIWINKVPGWWHYEDLYIEHSICTSEQFKDGFK